MAMQLTIKHPRGCDGGPTKLTGLEGSQTVAEVIAAFKGVVGITRSLRMRKGPQALRVSDTLADAGVGSGDCLSTDLLSQSTPAARALRRIEKGVQATSRAHKELNSKLDDIKAQQEADNAGLNAKLDEQEAKRNEQHLESGW